MSEIREIYQQEMKASHHAILDLKWQDKGTYAEWLAQTYFYAVHTTRIISLAGSLFPLERHDLHLRFLEHTKEEKNHEKILILDLKELGYSLDQFTPSFYANCLYQTQYYFIQNISPMSVYGYFLYLEGLAVEYGPQVIAKLVEHYPDKAIRYLKVHAEEDQDHVEQHYDFLGAATPAELVQIKKNLQQSSGLYRNMMLEIGNSKSAKRAA